MLKAVKELYISFCPLITHFYGLNKLQVLEVGGRNDTAAPFKISSGLEIFENLVELRARWVDFFESTREVDNSDIFLSFSDVQKLRSLDLEDCVFSHFTTIFTHLLSLRLVRCDGFCLIPGIPSLDSLKIISCDQLTELHLSGNGEKYPICKVKIHFCGQLKILRISRSISQLGITRCPNLSRVIIESQVNYLSVCRCPKLRGISQPAPIICSEWELESEEEENEEEEEDGDESEDENGVEDQNDDQDDSEQELEESEENNEEQDEESSEE
jgi:hypothetical protein